MSYSYLDGSQTGQLLQNLQQPVDNSSYIPAISGTQQQQYTPGYGQAPYADTAPAQDMNSLIAQYRGSGSTASFENWLNQNKGATVNTVPSYTSPYSSTDTSAQNSGGPTIAGYPSPSYWPMQNISGGTSGGGSSSGGMAMGRSGTNTTPTTSGILSSLNSGGVAPNSSPNLTQYGFPSGNLSTYSNPTGPSQAPQMSVAMQQADPNAARNQYQNSLGYQMLGNDQTNQYQQSPGYQFAVNEAMRQLNQNAASHGLLQSGSALRAATNQAVGMAQQDYGNWWNRQNQLYNDYQNRLAGLAGGPTGSAEAMQTGANLATGNMQAGSDLGTLFGNQGNTGMSGILNTGAAQTGLMSNAGTQAAQINQANQSTQLAGASLGRGIF